MRKEITRTFPVPRKNAYDYLVDFHTWPLWYTGVIEILEPEKAVWEKPGDIVRYAYKLLGRRMEGQVVLEEMDPAVYVKMMSTIPTVGESHFEWFYSDAGDDSFTLKVVMETEEPTKLFGKIIEKTLLPKLLERDLMSTFDHLDETFALGIPE